LWALANNVTNIRVPQIVGKFLTNCGTISLARRILFHGFGWLDGWL